MCSLQDCDSVHVSDMRIAGGRGFRIGQGRAIRAPRARPRVISRAWQRAFFGSTEKIGALPRESLPLWQIMGLL